MERWEISSDDLGPGARWRMEKRRLYGGCSDGVDLVTIDNGVFSFIVVPTRGMGLWKGEFRGISLDWGSPVKEAVHPSLVNMEARDGLGWLDGCNEWVVRCGLANFGSPGPDMIKDNRGQEKEVALTLHGRIANIPASVVKARIGLEPPFELGVEGVVYERSMFGPNLQLTTSITTTPGSNSVRISDDIRNLRDVSDEMQILYHCNYGNPFLGKDSRFVAPIRRIAPRDEVARKNIANFDVFGPPEAGFVEQVYFMELLGSKDGRTKVMLVDKDETKAVSVSFSLKELPFFTLWKNTAAVEDGYVTGLEPATSFPNPRRFEREKNRVVKLKPKENYHVEVVLSIHLGKDKIQKVNDEITRIRNGIKPVVYKEPVREFSGP